MWQKERKDSAIVSLALLLALATTPMAAPLFVSTPVLAQSATNSPAFSLPETVAEGTTVRIDGSMNLAAINQSLRRGFENQFSGTNVEVAANGTDTALQGLLDGSVDIVAMARGLTPQEQAQGLEQVVIHREKVAIIVGAENPFQGSLTDTQFARIFRGRITDWSQLGAPAAPIRFIDRPATSDTRNTFRTYPDFKVARFATGANATQIDEDNTAEIVAQLGNDGISYAMANHVLQMPNVRVIPLNNTLPDDPKYLFSQPLVYAYRENPTPQVASFLGFTLAAPGQTAIAEGRTAEAEAIAKGESQALFLADPIPVEEPVAQQPAETTPIPTEQIPLWWLLLPTAVIAGLLAWIFRSRLWTTEASNQPEALPENQAPIVTDNTIVSLPGNQPIGETISHNGAGTGSAIASAVTETSTDNKVISENINSSNYTEIDSYDLSESPWDIEAPAAVVNTSYPQMSDVPKVPPQPDAPVPAEEPNIEVAGNLTPEQDQSVVNETNEITAVAGGVTAGGSVGSQMENGNDTTQFSDSQEIIPEVQPPTDDDQEIIPEVQPPTGDAQEIIPEVTPPINENNNSLPTFSDIPEDKLNGVADEAEPLEMPEETEDLATGVVDEPLLEVDGERNITLQPRNAEWAYATWHISETCQQSLQTRGISQLALRLYDVTELDLSNQTPVFIQHYELEPGAVEIYVAIPQSGRDYIAEVGYVTPDDRWVTITRSPRVRVLDTPPTDTTDEVFLNVNDESSLQLKPRNAEWAYATWFIGEA
ncbi:substrate-binding domain-containing protein, partial [Nostoc sp. CCY0012]|uniref:substrate-binding domain-containing protein n=1 Tax=Nostoc sp. CCY0012 TaxID=1056123 RepID=UPI0039C6FBE2